MAFKIPFFNRAASVPMASSPVSLADVQAPARAGGWGYLHQMLDGLTEAFSGLGGQTDRVRHLRFEPPDRPTKQTVENAVEFDGVLERFITKPVEDILAEGFRFDSLTPEEQTDIDKYLSEIGFWPALERALVTKRMQRGAAIWLDTNALNNEQPLRPGELVNMKRLVVFSSESLWADTYKTNSYPTLWCVGDPDEQVRKIHRSRLLIFPGRFISDEYRQHHNGWGAREIDKIWEAWIAWRMTFLMPPNIALTYEEGVWGLESLNQKMTTPDGREMVRKKVFDLEAVRSFLRVRVRDTKDTFERLGVSATGLDGVMDRSENFFVSQTGYPRSILFGWSRGSSLNSDGKGEEQQALYRSMLNSMQEKELRPELEKFFRGLQPALQRRYRKPFANMALSFVRPDSESPMQKSERRQKDAQADSVYLTNSVVDRDEMRAELVKRGWALELEELPEIDAGVMEDDDEDD